MNLLASRTDAILLSEERRPAPRSKIGDPLQGQVTMGGSGGYQPRFTIVGTYKYFPTVFPDQPVAITNLDYLFSLTGGPTEHQIWLKLKDGAPVTPTLKAMSDMGVEAAGLQDAGALIGEEKAKTERVGVFGTLSVGFLAASAMALAGLLINTYASLNERLHSFAVLHAIGLQRRQDPRPGVHRVHHDHDLRGCRRRRDRHNCRLPFLTLLPHRGYQECAAAAADARRSRKPDRTIGGHLCARHDRLGVVGDHRSAGQPPTSSTHTAQQQCMIITSVKEGTL